MKDEFKNGINKNMEFVYCRGDRIYGKEASCAFKENIENLKLSLDLKPFLYKLFHFDTNTTKIVFTSYKYQLLNTTFD
jgi:uncharacterized pyridoxamine 5'-phosphate oxidase family protein